MKPHSSLIRLCGALVIAAVFVLGVTSYIVIKTRKPAKGAVVTVVKGIQQIPMSEVKALTKDHSHKPVKKPEKTPLPPAPSRKVSGIVQLTYTVKPDGQASDIKVVNAAPHGYYEKQAIHQVQSQYHKPKMGDDGRLKTSTQTKIIHFKVPARTNASH